MQQIGPAHDADELAISHDRQAFHAMTLHQQDNLVERGILVNRHDLPGHQLRNLAAVRLDILTGELAWANQKFEPPGTMLLRAGLRPAKEVSLGDDTDKLLVAVDDGQAANSMLQHQAHRLGHRGLGRNRDDLTGHDIGHFHSESPGGATLHGCVATLSSAYYRSARPSCTNAACLG